MSILKSKKLNPLMQNTLRQHLRTKAKVVEGELSGQVLPSIEPKGLEQVQLDQFLEQGRTKEIPKPTERELAKFPNKGYRWRLYQHFLREANRAYNKGYIPLFFYDLTDTTQNYQRKLENKRSFITPTSPNMSRKWSQSTNLSRSSSIWLEHNDFRSPVLDGRRVRRKTSRSASETENEPGILSQLISGFKSLFFQ
jgi:hypothetical protein